MIRAIACVAKDYGIGKRTGLLFDIPADMRLFRETTKGNVIVMGYSTYMSLPKRPLKNRVNVVLWDKATSIDCLPGCITFNKFEPLLHFVKTLAKQYDVYICGGASIYALFLKHTDELLLTKVDAVDEEATAFFPNVEESGLFKLESEERIPISDDTNGYDISVCVYSRIEDVKAPEKTKWSDLYELRICEVPQDIKDYMAQKAADYAASGFGYDGKDYASAKALQIDVNSNSDEATLLKLINENGDFVANVNAALSNWTEAKGIPQFGRIAGKYEFNSYHGLHDHDLPLRRVAEPHKTSVDLLRSKDSPFDKSALWSLEVKSSAYRSKPSSMHFADLVFLHVLGTSDVIIYASPLERASRIDDSYEEVCTVSGFGDWKNVRIDEQFRISKW